MIERENGPPLRVVLIAAMSENRVIAKDGDLPWHVPEDLARFRRVTMGHPVILGRTTFETLPKSLDGRLNIVLTSRDIPEQENVRVARTLEQALEIGAAWAPAELDRLYVAGGGEVYAAAVLVADELDVTVMEETLEGDVHFPHILPTEWTRESVDAHSDGTRSFRFERWLRRKSG